MSSLPVSRRSFVGGVSAAMGAFVVSPGRSLSPRDMALASLLQQRGDDYDSLAKLAANENPYGPPDSVMKAMTDAFKYANRYGYPDGNIVAELAAHHGVKSENILLGAGSGEILDVV